MARCQRHRQDVKIGIGCGRQQGHAADGDGHDEHADQQQIKRKQPGRGRDMAFFGVLDDGDLELPGQADDRRRRQERQHYPARLEAFREAVKFVDFGVRRRLGEQIA